MHLLRNYVKSALARRPLQPVWRLLHRLSIYGMGYRLPDPSLSGEDLALRMVRRELSGRPRAVIVDAGARFGELTEIFAEAPNCEIHAFEPNPASMAVLAEKFAAAGNVILNQLAILDREGEAEFFDEGDEGSPFATTIRERLEAFGKSARVAMRVKTTTLDVYFRDVPGDLALVKIDIEGAEEAAIAGAAQLLRDRRIEMLLLEHSHVSALSGLTIYRICASFPDFAVYRLIPGSVAPIRTRGRPYSPWDEVMSYCNLLLVRNDLPLSEPMRRYLRMGGGARD